MPNTSYVSIPVIWFLALFTYLVIRLTGLPWEVFGLTLHNWKRALCEAFIFLIPGCLALVLVKWALIEFHPSFSGHKLFEPFNLIANKHDRNFQYWLILNGAYWVFVPLQELMARGALQGLLERFLTGKYKIGISIFASNLIFSTAHVFISETLGIIMLGSGMVLGYLYSRTHTLIGCTVAHALGGTWALSVIGFMP